MKRNALFLRDVQQVMLGLAGGSLLVGCVATNSDVPVLTDEVDAATPTSEDLLPPDLAMPDLLPPPPRCSGKGAMTAGTTTLKMMSRGKERTYLLHIPTGYDPTKPTDPKGWLSSDCNASPKSRAWLASRSSPASIMNTPSGRKAKPRAA